MINVFISVPKDLYDRRAELAGADIVRKSMRDAASDDPQLARKNILGRVLQSVYVDSQADIGRLRAAGAVILGAWDWDGRQVVKPSPNLRRFMPPRFQQDGETVTEIDDEQVRDLNLRFGQKERDFG